MSFFDFSIRPGDGRGFGLFSPAHLAALLLCAAGIAAACLAARRLGAAGRRRLSLGIAWSALSLELLRALVLALAGEYPDHLPLHLCSLAVFLLPLHAGKRGRLTGQFLYAFCLPGAAAALLLPDWRYYPLFHFMPLCGFTLHALTVAYVLAQLPGGELRPEAARLPACLALMLALAAPVYLFDRLTGSNYMFLNWPPADTPLAWFAPWGRLFVLGYLPLAAALWLPMYLPFLRKKD